MLLFQIPLQQDKPTLSSFDLSTKKCQKPDPDPQTTIPEMCPSSPKDEQEKQGQESLHKFTMHWFKEELLPFRREESNLGE
ncbi:hypothetical protein TNCV_3385421 [Trichonephila clavipes]|uniref:Uncharacterized protein n=1 Tax=Trichonephila clavipes TaxID=2585209 RepID=A0A8X6T180_TRICX|nr:hypothetical protein TNCV_3385421 [Trichonephila clavipes]